MFTASAPLVLPNGYVKREWIEAQYMNQIKASQEAASLGQDVINAKLTELSASPGGLQFIGKELRSPLLREMLYESVCRNLLQVYKLSQGETAEFWSDIAVPAAHIGVSGLPGQSEIRPDYTRVDTRMFVTNPYVRWNVSNLAKYDVLNATQQRMKASLMYQEAAFWMRLLRYASGLRSGQGTVPGLEPTTSTPTGNEAYYNHAPLSVQSSIAGRLTVDQLAIAQARFGSRLIKGAKKLYINPARQSDLVLFNFAGPGGGGGNGFFAPNTQEVLLNKGNIGNFLGMDVYEDIVVPETDTAVAVDSKGVVAGNEDVIGYILGPAEFVGVMAIRTDLSIETQKDATRFADILAGWQDLGLYLRYVKAVQRLTSA